MASVGTNPADRAALDHLATILRAPEWEGADYLEVIAAIVIGTGRSIVHTLPCRGCGLGGWYDETCSAHAEDDGPIRFRVKYETADGEEAASHDAFTRHDEAMAWYRDVIDGPADGLGAVYMTSLTGDDEHVIASHSFADAAAVVPIAEQHPTRTENDAAPGTSCATSGECPDGQHRWMVVREYHGRDYFFVTKLDEQPDGVRVTADSSVDSDEIVEVHSERLACRDCPAERGDVTMADYR